MQGADWLLRCRKNRGRIKTSQCDSLEILCEETGEKKTTTTIVKKNNNNKQHNYNKKRVWLGENLRKKTVNMFLESYSAIFSKMQF